MFEPGTLWEAVVRTTERAIRSGDLQSIPTNGRFIEEGGIRFLVRVVDNLARKDRVASGGSSREGPRRNPFLPYEQALYVADPSATHVCVLNKFNVVDHHLLIITRDFEHQQSPLRLADFQALWACLLEYDSLGFYNGGKVAGASQPHKHLQLIPLPLVPNGNSVPIAPLIDPGQIARPFGRCDLLPFRHAIAVLDGEDVSSATLAAERCLQLYRKMMDAVERPISERDQDCDPGPYNLLVTRRWMMVVPRQAEHFCSISLNALAFAGAILVRDEAQLAVLRASGPMAALCHTAGEFSQA